MKEKLEKIKEILKTQKFINELNENVSKYAFHEFFMDCWSENMTIREFIDKNPSEHSVIVGVKFGNIFQNSLKRTLTEVMSNDITSSEKDLELFEIPFELKTVREGLCFQGATHSFSKCSNYILLMFSFIDNIIMKNETDNLIKGLALSISINLLSKENWHGTASEKNSRTTLRLPINMIDSINETLIYGKATPKKKWIAFTTENLY
jgi:hypothetical protein